VDVRIRKGLFGRFTVSYACDKCKAALTSPLDDAGKDDNCPDCGTGFTVPGVEERNRIQNEERLQAERLACEKLEKKQREEEQRRQRDEQIRSRKEQEAKLAQLRTAEQQPPKSNSHQQIHSQENALIRCPYCAEEIQATAKKCKHCGEEDVPLLVEIGR